MNYSRTNTDTTRFLLPLLGFTKEQVINEDFINAYLYTKNFIAEDNLIILVYKEEQQYLELEVVYRNGYYYYFVDIRPKTYKRFIDGKYSQLEYSEKRTILDFWNLDKPSKMHNILFPATHLQESFNLVGKGLLFHKKNIWFPPNTIKETFIQTQYEDLISNGT